MAGNALVLRDIHLPSSPSWWPPAPGWWAVAAALLAVMVAIAWWRGRVRRRREAIGRMFDQHVDTAPTSALQVAAMSDLLRRASRRRDPLADRLSGEEWLRFLDPVPPRKGKPPPKSFSEGAGRLLLDGGFRRDVDTADVEALRRIARERFLQWMSAA